MRSIPVTCILFYLFTIPTCQLFLSKCIHNSNSNSNSNSNNYDDYLNCFTTAVSDEMKPSLSVLYYFIPMLMGLLVMIFYLSIGQLRGLLTREAYEDICGTIQPMTLNNMRQVSKRVGYGCCLVLIFLMGFLVFSIAYSPIVSFVLLVIVESYTRTFSLFVISVPLLATQCLSIMSLLFYLLFVIIAQRYSNLMNVDYYDD